MVVSEGVCHCRHGPGGCSLSPGSSPLFLLPDLHSASSFLSPCLAPCVSSLKPWTEPTEAMSQKDTSPLLRCSCWVLCFKEGRAD